MQSRAQLSLEMAYCARAIARTIGGEHLDRALDLELHTSTPPGSKFPGAAALPTAALPTEALPAASRAPVRDMAYATMRGFGLASFLADRLNLRKPSPLLGALQWVALTGLLDGRRAAAIVIDQAVAAAQVLQPGAGAKPAGGFINATLRRFLRERASLLQAASQDLQASYNLPRWWVELLIQHYPDRWREIIAASATKAALTVRVNSRATEVEAITQRFDAAGIRWQRTGLAALTLEQAIAVERIPGFSEGLVSVQDGGAQLAAPLLGARTGERVLDACAAPGGKTTHLLELVDCEVVALELDRQRALRIRQNLERERLHATVVEGDATRPDDWWDGRSFDRIMIDAPCSASGIVRRHPDVPWHRRRSDIATFARGQQQLLDALWPLLKPGGTLVYVTCSIFPEEGESVITAFCSQHPDAERRPAIVRWANGESTVSQLLPSDPREHDGFYYALLSRRT